MALKYKILGITITIFYLFVHLFLINNFGISWDFHYHLYAGKFHLGLPVPKINDPEPVPFSPPDPRLTTEDPFGPFTQIIPAVFHHYLFEQWHLLPQDAAYNFPIIIFGAGGIAAIYFFLLETLGIYPAVVASVSLALLPVYIGYTHNDMKDIPNAFAFTLALYFFWRLVIKRRWRDLLIAAIVFAIAFNIKINSVVVPVICGVWVLVYFYKEIFLIFSGKINTIWKEKIHIVGLYFFLAPIFAVILWWPFWKNPLGKLLELPQFYANNTYNMPVLFNGVILRSGINLPFYYPFYYLSITLPIPILIFSLIGLVICLKKWNRGKGIYSLIILWFLIPLVRYFSPKSGAIDGVRHFLEAVYPICAIAAVGYTEIIKKNIFKVIISAGIIIYLLFINIHYHPYQTSYFNALIGGIRGASGKFDVDFWGTPQKEAALWLNNVAPSNASVHIVMAQSSAAIYLRDDLRKNSNKDDIWKSDFVILLNRESFFTIYDVRDYMTQKIAENKVIYTRKIDGIPLVWIFKK
jgi:hypothetical protein